MPFTTRSTSVSNSGTGPNLVVGLEADAADVLLAREEQKGLGDDTVDLVGRQFVADGAGADGTGRPVQAQVRAAAVVLGARVGAANLLQRARRINR